MIALLGRGLAAGRACPAGGLAGHRSSGSSLRLVPSAGRVAVAAGLFAGARAVRPCSACTAAGSVPVLPAGSSRYWPSSGCCVGSGPRVRREHSCRSIGLHCRLSVGVARRSASPVDRYSVILPAGISEPAAGLSAAVNAAPVSAAPVFVAPALMPPDSCERSAPEQLGTVAVESGSH